MRHVVRPIVRRLIPRDLSPGIKQGQTGPNRANRAKQGEMGLRKPEFSGTTRNPGRNGHDSRAIGRNDHSLGTRQDASLSLCDSGGLSRGSSLVEKWIRVHMPGFWKPFDLGGTHGTPYFPCESISFLLFFPIES